MCYRRSIEVISIICAFIAICNKQTHFFLNSALMLWKIETIFIFPTYYQCMYEKWKIKHLTSYFQHIISICMKNGRLNTLTFCDAERLRFKYAQRSLRNLLCSPKFIVALFGLERSKLEHFSRLLRKNKKKHVSFYKRRLLHDSFFLFL